MLDTFVYEVRIDGYITSLETIRAFAEKHGASLTVMKGGEHWFHTEEEMKFLDEWIRSQK